MNWTDLSLLAVLEERLAKEVGELQALIKEGKQLVLLDGDSNVNVYDYSRPVAAAELLRCYLLNQWPSEEGEHQHQNKVCNEKQVFVIKLKLTSLGRLTKKGGGKKKGMFKWMPALKTWPTVIIVRKK